MYSFKRTLAAMAVGVDVNPLAGDLIERLPIHGYLEVAVAGSVAGITFDVLINGRQIALGEVADVGAVPPPDPRTFSISNAIVYRGDVRGQLTFILHTTAISTPSVSVRLSPTARV